MHVLSWFRGKGATALHPVQPNFRVAAFYCLAAALFMARLPKADAAGDRNPARRAFLVGVERYTGAPALAFVSNDVHELGLTLRERGGYEVVEIVDRPDASGRAPGGRTRNEAGSNEAGSEATHQAATHPALLAGPESAALMRCITAWLTRLGPEDNALIYFSGHGFRDQNGRLYLAAIDCQPSDPVPGGVPVEWLRNQPDYAKCLHEAKRWVRKQDKWKSPYYWAPFVLVGPH